MANQTEIGSLAINLQVKLESLEKGIETAKKKLQEIEEQNGKVQDSNKKLDASFLAMSVGIIAALSKIKSAMNSGLDAYKEYESANKGLESIVRGQGLSFDDAQGFIQEYISDGLIPLSDATLAYKNLAARGYNEDQIKKTMLALKDAAAFGRQSTYEYGQAIATATEGLKNENSVLVDNAGVTKNVAKMWQDYAKQHGKTTEQLTQAEKVQAEVNGILEESKNQMGDAAKFADTFAGQQAKLNASATELKKTFGEGMVPVVKQLIELVSPIVSGLTEFIKNNKALSAGLVTLFATLGTGTIVVTTIKKAVDAFKASEVAATIASDGLTTALKANPLFFAASALISAISAVTAAISGFNAKTEESIKKIEEKTAKTEELTKALCNFQESFTFTDNEKDLVEKEVKECQEIVNIYEDKKKKIEEIENQIKEIKKSNKLEIQQNAAGVPQLQNQLSKLKKELKDLGDEYLTNGKTVDTFKQKIEQLNKMLQLSSNKQKYLTNTNQKAHRETLINIAQTKADIRGKQELLNVLKKGETTTQEYTNAKQQLVKAYPELANVNENTINSTQEMLDTESKAADIEWANAQIAIQASMAEVRAMQANSEQIKQIATATQQSVEDVTRSLEEQINVLSNLAKLSPDDFKGAVTSNYTPRVSSGGRSGGGSKAYQNKKLDEYKELIEYKKSMDQISLKTELKMYKTALNSYAKTTKERRELMVKIHDLEKEINEKSLNDYTAKQEHKRAIGKLSLNKELKNYTYAYNKLAKTREEKWQLEEKIYDLKKEQEEQLTEKFKKQLDERTKATEDHIEERAKLEGASYTAVDRQKDYDKLIKIHQNYLDKVLASEKISKDKKKEIYQEELDAIKSYEQQKRDLRVESIDNTVGQLKDAIVKQLQEMQEADKKAIEDNIAMVEKWKETRINAINEEYNARIEAIQRELDLLDKSEQDKTRAEEDAEYERKKNRLQELIAYEHDVTTKLNYEKELNKLVEDYQKKLDKRTLDDKKAALKEKQDLLKEEQNKAVETVNTETEAIKNSYNEQLNEINDYYKKQQDIAQDTAEKMLLNVKDNQNQIINLLKKYGNQYEITGQSLGEKLAQGINEGITSKIESVIKKLQKRIDTALENKIAGWMSGIDNTTNSTAAGKSVVVNQNNYIQQTPDMPSETYRKLKNIEQKLADQLAGA